MTIKEFIDNNCSRCKNKNRIKDDCNIVKNIDGELQCVNMEIEEEN